MLIDTSGLLCCINASEPCHSEALQMFRAAKSMVSHSYVLAEFTTLASVRGISLEAAYEFAIALTVNLHLEIVWVEAGLHLKALDLLMRRPDKTYSLCDAVSFVLMRERSVSEALTTDHHFVQEGFTRLLSP